MSVRSLRRVNALAQRPRAPCRHAHPHPRLTFTLNQATPTRPPCPPTAALRPLPPAPGLRAHRLRGARLHGAPDRGAHRAADADHLGRPGQRRRAAGRRRREPGAAVTCRRHARLSLARCAGRRPRGRRAVRRDRRDRRPSATSARAAPGRHAPGPAGLDRRRPLDRGTRLGRHGGRLFLGPRACRPSRASLAVTDTGLVFRSADGRYGRTLPVVGPVRRSRAGRAGARRRSPWPMWTSRSDAPRTCSASTAACSRPRRRARCWRSRRIPPGSTAWRHGSGARSRAWSRADDAAGRVVAARPAS